MTTNAGTKKLGSFPAIYYLLAAIAAVGVVLGVIRLFLGLGPTTHLSDSYPWGLWIAFDFFAVPLSAGAFTLAFVTQIANRKEYDAVAHLSLLAGFLGYTMVVLVLIMDIGRWDQFWSVLLPWRWNLHSFMFEVSLSITLYFGVMVLELIPVIFKNSKSNVVQLVHRFVPLIAAVGILLSTVHQGSIGAIFLLLGHKLHPLWWSPILPLFYLTSAIFSGLTITIFYGIITWRALKRPVPKKMLINLVKIVVIVQVIYLLLKLGDLIVAGELGLVFSSGVYSLIFILEIVIGVLIPLAIFATRAREKTNYLLAGAICVMIGLAINRWTQAWFALKPWAGSSYSPQWIEWWIVAAAFAGGILFYSLGLRFIPGLRKPVLEDAH